MIRSIWRVVKGWFGPVPTESDGKEPAHCTSVTSSSPMLVSSPGETYLSRESAQRRLVHNKAHNARLSRLAEERERREQEASGDFATSAMIAGATNSAALGYLAGGSLSGAIVGDALAPDEPPSQADPVDAGGGDFSGGGASESWGSGDSGGSSDSGGSYDSGSSSDGGGGGGSD